MELNLKEHEAAIRKMLVCGFGYHEVEDEILNRCMEAIENGSMRYLNKGIVMFCAGDNHVYMAEKEKVCSRLKKIGVWDYVEKLIKAKRWRR